MPENNGTKVEDDVDGSIEALLSDALRPRQRVEPKLTPEQEDEVIAQGNAAASARFDELGDVGQHFIEKLGENWDQMIKALIVLKADPVLVTALREVIQVLFHTRRDVDWLLLKAGQEKSAG